MWNNSQTGVYISIHLNKSTSHKFLEVGGGRRYRIPKIVLKNHEDQEASLEKTG